MCVYVQVHVHEHFCVHMRTHTRVCVCVCVCVCRPDEGARFPVAEGMCEQDNRHWEPLEEAENVLNC